MRGITNYSVNFATVSSSRKKKDVQVLSLLRFHSVINEIKDLIIKLVRWSIRRNCQPSSSKAVQKIPSRCCMLFTRVLRRLYYCELMNINHSLYVFYFGLNSSVWNSIKATSVLIVPWVSNALFLFLEKERSLYHWL